MSHLNDQLEAYRREFEAIEAETHDLIDGLSDVHLTWQPTPTAWSIRTCLDHLIIAGRTSLVHVAEAVAEARARGIYDSGPFRYRAVERWFVWLMGAPARVKFPTPRAYHPRIHRPADIVVAEFLQLQEELRQSLREANGLDLARVKVRNPVTRWIRFSLGQEYALTAAHERRHLQQVRRVAAHTAFPPGVRRPPHESRIPVARQPRQDPG
jgi:hypothetical protein